MAKSGTQTGLNRTSQTSTKSRRPIAKKQNNRFNKQVFALFIVVSILFWLLRLWNFDELMTFHSDQALHIQESYNMVAQRKIQLIGPIVLTHIVEGRGFFIGPQYLYVLALLGILLNWNVILITKFLIFLWWGAAVALFIWIGKKLSWPAALFTYLLITVIPPLIWFSRMILNPNFLVAISVGFFYFLWMAVTKRQTKYWLMAGIFAGLGFSFHFIVMTWLAIIAFAWAVGLILRKFKLTDFLAASLGVLIGDLPYIVFELRHDFYNTRTFIANLSGPGRVEFPAGYYLFAFFPILAWIIAVVFHWLSIKIKPLYFVPLAIFLLVIAVRISDDPEEHGKGYGMPRGWSLQKQQFLADFICNDMRNHPSDPFEVATFISADIRGEDLRWWVKRCGFKPLGYDGYPLAKILYFVDRGEFQSGNAPGTWELAAMTTDPYEETVRMKLENNLWFYKLVRK